LRVLWFKSRLENELHLAMIDNWVGHYHRQPDDLLSRLPAELKLGIALILIVGTVLIPTTQLGWYLGAAAGLLLALLLSRIPPLFVLKRLAWLSPLILGVALLNAFQPAARLSWWAVAAKSTMCLVTIILVSNTTPFSQILRVLKRSRVPGLLITTIALMHRYLFVLVEEAERLRRARASRTFLRQRRLHWQTLASVIAQLFVRASERAERIYDAMCARGWK
jgi:cobalt/nickel transport system permease protein